MHLAKFWQEFMMEIYGFITFLTSKGLPKGVKSTLYSVVLWHINVTLYLFKKTT